MSSENKKYSQRQMLYIGLVFDAIGMISIIFPPIDFIWAPLSAFLMMKMYKGKKGKIAAIVSFVEEALPFLDIVPTFTLMWLYTFVFNKEKTGEILNKD